MQKTSDQFVLTIYLSVSEISDMLYKESKQLCLVTIFTQNCLSVCSLWPPRHLSLTVSHFDQQTHIFGISVAKILWLLLLGYTSSSMCQAKQVKN